MSKIAKNLLRGGLVFALVTVIFDTIIKSGDHRKKHQLGITQRELNDLQPQELDRNGKTEILNPETGVLDHFGWQTNKASLYHINYKDVPSNSPLPIDLRYRGWDFFMLYLGENHIVQIPLAKFSPVCVTSIQIYSREKGDKEFINSKKKQESPMIGASCPSLNLESTNLEEKPLLYDDGSLVIAAARTNDGKLSLKLEAKQIEFSGQFILEVDEVDAQFFSMPLNQEKTHYFINNKRFGIKTTGDYTYQGVKHKCEKCIALYDVGRGHFNYQTSWYWASLATYLPNGDTFALNLGEGIGTEYESKDNFYEDFAILNGKHYKLDQTTLADFEDESLNGKHTFRTVDSTHRVFKDRHCDLTFEPLPDKPPRDGMDFVFIAFIQDLVYGYYSGKCMIEGKEIKLERVLGTVEHVRARW